MPPTNLSLNPITGPTSGGTPVTISAQNNQTILNGASAVKFGGVPGLIFSLMQNNTITVTTPPNNPGVVDVVILSGSNTLSTLSNAYTYTQAPPTITNLLPNNGLANAVTTVIITGTNYIGTPTVLFGATLATNVILNSQTQITADSPTLSAGSVGVIVTVNGIPSLPATFTYTAP